MSYKPTAVICQNIIDFTNWAYERGIKPKEHYFIDNEGEKYVPVFKVDHIMGSHFSEVETTNDILEGSYLHVKAMQRIR